MNLEKKHPLVTIAIPTYNSVVSYSNDDNILRKALSGYVEQDYPNLEILIRDNNSQDNTFEICKEYAEKFPIITLYQNEKNIGVYNSLSKLLNMAKGKYFIFASSDDFYSPSYIRKTVGMLESTSSAACQSFVKTIYKDSEQVEKYIDISRGINKEILTNILFDRKNNDLECTSLNNYIHALLPLECAKIIFRFPCMGYYEVLQPMLLVWMRGISVVKEVLYENTALKLFKERYPGDIFTKQSTSFLFIFINGIKVLVSMFYFWLTGAIDLKIRHVIYFWWKLFYFYFLNNFLNIIKVKVFNYCFSKFPWIINYYRILKKTWGSY